MIDPASTLLRDLCGTTLPATGLGCMNLSHAYGHPPPAETGRQVLRKALDLGIRHFDTAALYGFGANEKLVGEFLKPVRKEVLLASKCGIRGVDGKRQIDGRPEALARDIDDSLERLQTDVIDLCYLHRWDRRVPIEDSIGALGRFVEQGKVRAIGLSEVSAETIRKAHAVHPLAAVQSEYSLWSRNAEIAVLDTCGELGIAFVAFSPLARGFLAGADLDPGHFAEKDIRRGMPRFQEPQFSQNVGLLRRYKELADAAGCTPAQLALAWVLRRRPFIHVIPGTTSIAHLEEDFDASTVSVPEAIASELDGLINNSTVRGERYPAATLEEIDTERFSQ